MNKRLDLTEEEARLILQAINCVRMDPNYAINYDKLPPLVTKLTTYIGEYEELTKSLNGGRS